MSLLRKMLSLLTALIGIMIVSFVFALIILRYCDSAYGFLLPLFFFIFLVVPWTITSVEYHKREMTKKRKRKTTKKEPNKVYKIDENANKEAAFRFLDI